MLNPWFLRRRGLELDPKSEAMQRGLADAESRLRVLTSEYEDLASDDDEAASHANAAATHSNSSTGRQQQGPEKHAGGKQQSAQAASSEQHSGPDVFVVSGNIPGFRFPDVIDYQVSHVERSLGLTFMDAAKKGDVEKVQASLLMSPDLIWYRGQTTSAGFVGHSALHWAAAKGHVECLLALIAAGADIHAKNRGGTTVLHTAAMNDSIKCVEILLRCGANPLMVDDGGEKAEEAARRRGKVGAANAIAHFVSSGKKIEGAAGVCGTATQASKLRAWVRTFNDAKEQWVTARRTQRGGSGQVDDSAPAASDSHSASHHAHSLDALEQPRRGQPVVPQQKPGGGGATSRRPREAKESADSSSSSDDAVSGDKAKSRIEGLSAKGNQAFAKKDYKAAISAYSVAINLDKGNEKLLSNRSAAYAGAGLYEKALVMCAKYQLAHVFATEKMGSRHWMKMIWSTLAPHMSCITQGPHCICHC
jgi:hypothetical protein